MCAKIKKNLKGDIKMTKRIIAILLLTCMALVLLAACDTTGAIDDKKATEIALKDMGITEDQAEEIHAHVGDRDGVAGYNVYITYHGEQTAYFIHGKTGEILHKGPGGHSH
jgi:predicted small secreted protein